MVALFLLIYIYIYIYTFGLFKIISFGSYNLEGGVV